MDADRLVPNKEPDEVEDVRPEIDAALKVASDSPMMWRMPVNYACVCFDIDTEKRIQMFVAQCAHESQRFTHLKESLHYSAQRLLQVFPKYFTDSEVFTFAYDDSRIAERIYGGRMGNGPQGCGDGFRFRGRGLIQLTGRSNYRACSAGIGADVEAKPDLLELPMHASLSAAWYWHTHKCNELADADDFEGITRAINGGLNGYDDRLAWLDKLRTA